MLEQDRDLGMCVSARDHFIGVANGDISMAIRELDDALDEGFILMHNRAFYKLHRAKNKWLGEDVYAQRVEAEWDALAPEEKKAIESGAKGYGKYGMFDSVSRIEVPLALTVAVRLLSKEFNLDDYTREKLSDPEMVKRITQRFPLIQENDIAEALEPT
ncbi:MAG TPA: hypothetical protein PKI93_07480 [Alphaproteobacteria bacterium]|nr:hypothetical protein [Alphaproteobacteria bacterium]HNS44492.1 hypothetical protein [Alphaproteobacteria bacterium]